MGINDTMKKFFLILCLAVSSAGAFAQDSAKTAIVLPRYKVAVFSPLYLDSVFSGSYYRYGKSIPKFAMQGIEFAEGARIANDSSLIPYANVETTIFDSKARQLSINNLISSGQLNDYNLIIGNVRDAEYSALADFAKTKKVPFISATLPNDGGKTNNPYLLIANPTLRAHCEAIFTYLLQTNSGSNILLVRKPGAQEDKIEQFIKNSNTPDGSKLLSIKTINVMSDITQINYHLDSTKNNVIIAGSLNESFSQDLTFQAAKLSKNYAIMVIGMPNWDGFNMLNNKKELLDFPIYYTTPYYNLEGDAAARKVKYGYTNRMKLNPTDLTYKAYDLVYTYTRLLARFGPDLINHLNEYPQKVFSDFNFKPVYLNGMGTEPDYFENKRLYILRSLNGSTTKVW